MGISIKNEEVEALIRQMAQATGKPITESIRLAVLDWLENQNIRQRTNEEVRQKKLDELIKRMHAWPVYDDRDHGDMLYDKDGLPK